MLDFRDLKVLNSAGVEFDSGVKHDSPFAKEIGRSDRWLQRTELKKCTTIGNLKLEVKAKCFGILVAAVSNFVISGSTTLRQSAHTFGEGLVWNKLNYRFRQEAIGHYLTKTVNRFLAEPDFLPLQKSMITHAMPDAMSVVEARELVGRPFLKDLEHLPNVDIGPVHIIGVYKNATENQIRDIIGHQDVAIIQDGFGFYVWDLVNHIQLIYITHCKDPEVTAIQTQAFFTWLRVQDETRFVIDRASRRKEILKTIDAQKVELKGTLK
jgi:hypothetical protein